MSKRHKSHFKSFLVFVIMFGSGAATWAYKVPIAHYVDSHLSTNLTKYVR